MRKIILLLLLFIGFCYPQSYLFDDDELFTIKANGTDWIFNKDNETVISDFGITKAKINAATIMALYSDFEYRNKFLDHQFGEVNYFWDISLARLILGYTQ